MVTSSPCSPGASGGVRMTERLSLNKRSLTCSRQNVLSTTRVLEARNEYVPGQRINKAINPRATESPVSTQSTRTNFLSSGAISGLNSTRHYHRVAIRERELDLRAIARYFA